MGLGLGLVLGLGLGLVSLVPVYMLWCPVNFTCPRSVRRSSVRSAADHFHSDLIILLYLVCLLFVAVCNLAMSEQL